MAFEQYRAHGRAGAHPRAADANPDSGPPGVYAWGYAAAMAVAILLALVYAAEAKPAAKKPADAEPAALSDMKPVRPGPARFFTINEVLARRDQDRAGAGGRTAAVEARASATDAAAPASRIGPEPFGLFAFRAPDGLLWKKWRGLESDLAGEARELADCRERDICSDAATRWRAMLAETKGRTGHARLETANRLVNAALRYVSDGEQHGEADLWRAPLAALAAGRGDCEEYAIAKYALLREAGVPESELRLVLVRDTAIRVDHAVLAARFEDRWVVLDNRRGAVTEVEDLRHYQPLYALDREGVKLFATPYALWGERDADFAGWTLRGVEFVEWELRGSDAEPAATGPAETF